MDAKKLEILMTAVDLGSFSRASEVVGYTQSGLTHLVNSLETESASGRLFTMNCCTRFCRKTIR